MVRVARAGRRWTRALLGAALLCGALGSAGPLDAQPAGADGVSSATASAAGVATTTQDPSAFPLGAVVEADAPTAQASLGSTGESNGYASALYPGSFALALPGLLAAQGAPELPPYPLYVESDAALHRTAEVHQPGVSLSSTSSPGASTAQAQTGGATQQANVASSTATASVAVDHTAGTVTAQAGSDTEVISAGPLHIGRVVSHAEAARTGGSTLRRGSTLDVADVSVNGVGVALTDHGLQVGNNASPLPGDPIAGQLAQAGVSVTYLAAREVPDGVVSPAVRVDIRHRESGLLTSMIIGQSLAVASSTAGPAFAAPPVIGVVSPPAGGSPPSGSGITTATGAAGRGTVGLQPAPPAAAPSTDSQTRPGTGPRVTHPLAAAARTAGPVPGTGFYLLVVIAAAGALLCGQLISWVGVRWARPS